MENDIVTSIPSSSSSNISSPSNGDGMSNMWKYIIIFLILALFGFNLLTYFGQFSKLLGSIVDQILNFFRPILAYFGYGVGEATKATVNVTAGVVDSGIDVLEKGLKKPASKWPKNNNKLKKDLKRLADGSWIDNNNNTNNDFNPSKYPLPAESDNLHQGKGNRKAGFCYIGEDRGFRSCITVGEGDDCMSQNIYPTMDQCINPNLRSG